MKVCFQYSVILVLLLAGLAGKGQNSLHYKLSAQNITSDKAPFWLIMNQDGRYSTDPVQFYGMGQLTDSLQLFSDFYINSGVEIITGKQTTPFQNQLRLHQGYLQLHTPYINFTAGKKENPGTKKMQVNSGKTIWSRNAAPIPSVQVSTNDFIDVPYSRGYLEFKALYAHRWMGKQRSTKNPFIHQKYLYGKVGGDFPVNIWYGLHHIVQWGGDSPQYGEFPVTWEAYKQIVLSQHGTESTTPNPGGIKNRIGNHIGSHKAGIVWNNNNYMLEARWQTIFEDGSGKELENKFDGLWGITFTSKKDEPVLKSVTLEYLRTTHQSGHKHDIGGEILRGNDNYFNNGTYGTGWTHKGYTIGNPFITSPVLDIYRSLRERDGETIVRYVPNNKVIAWHTGIKGHISKNIGYRALFSYTRNYGVNKPQPYYDDRSNMLAEYVKKTFKDYDNEFYYQLPDLRQFYGMLEISFDFKLKDIPLTAKSRIGFDAGEFTGNRFGVFVSLSHKGSFSSSKK